MIKFELEQKIARLQTEIEQLYNRNDMELETRISQIAARQHKIACCKTRIELLNGTKNHNIHLVNDLKWTHQI